MAGNKQLSARCRCGAIELIASGRPIVTSICYCTDCQAAARQIAAHGDAPGVAGSDDGTEYLLFRKDRISCTKGAQRLEALRLTDTSATRRMIASCCGSPMYMAFDDMRHWVSVYRDRIVGDAPPLEMRICTRFRTSDEPLDSSISNYSGYAPRLMARLLASRLAMLIATKSPEKPL